MSVLDQKIQADMWKHAAYLVRVLPDRIDTDGEESATQYLREYLLDLWLAFEGIDISGMRKRQQERYWDRSE